MREQSFNSGTRYRRRWKFRTVRNSPIFTEVAFKSSSENASPVPTCLGEELQGCGEAVRRVPEVMSPSIVPQPPIYPR